MKIKLVLFLSVIYLILPLSLFSQNDWNRIVYYNSSGESSNGVKPYYIITIRNNGNGKLEYFKGGFAKEYEFHSGKSSMKKFNTLLDQSGIYSIDPQDIKSEVPLQSPAVLNMTLFFEKTKENYLHYNNKEFTEEEIEEKRKEPFLAVPSDYNIKYSEMINKIYTGLENLVPDETWEAAMSGN